MSANYYALIGIQKSFNCETMAEAYKERMYAIDQIIDMLKDENYFKEFEQIYKDYKM